MHKVNTSRLPLAHPNLGTWPTTQTCALPGNQTSDPSFHRPALNPLGHTSQGSLSILILGLPINEQGISFHLVRFSFTSFNGIV